jgi:GNAT superfamily N-acetyltransferase
VIGPVTGSVRPTTIERGTGVIECHLVPWDTEVFGFPVAEIGRLELPDESDARKLLEALDSWCIEHDVRLMSCRLDHERLRESMALEGVGFRFVETVYEPRLELDAAIDEPQREILVEDAGPDDADSIEAIARDAFTTGRFLLDRRLPSVLSGARYAYWVRTSLRTPAHAVLTARLNGDLIGFFIVERRTDGTVYWHLTAVAPGWQGKGIGGDLWRTMLLRHRAEGASRIETTISGHNLPAMNLYGRLGFAFRSARMTFHWLRDPAWS